MARKKLEIYRIKDESTGLYYNGGVSPQLKNDDYDPKAKRPNYGTPNYTNYDDIYLGKHPWNRYYKTKWDNVGKVFLNYKGCEKIISRLSKTSKSTRATKASNLLFGNAKSNNYKIVRVRIVDIKE